MIGNKKKLEKSKENFIRNSSLVACKPTNLTKSSADYLYSDPGFIANNNNDRLLNNVNHSNKIQKLNNNPVINLKKKITTRENNYNNNNKLINSKNNFLDLNNNNNQYISTPNSVNKEYFKNIVTIAIIASSAFL